MSVSCHFILNDCWYTLTAGARGGSLNHSYLQVPKIKETSKKFQSETTVDKNYQWCESTVKGNSFDCWVCSCFQENMPPRLNLELKVLWKARYQNIFCLCLKKILPWSYMKHKQPYCEIMKKAEERKQGKEQKCGMIKGKIIFFSEWYSSFVINNKSSTL